MESSLRFRSDDSHLLLHAKESFTLDKSYFLQFYGTLNTHTGGTRAIAHVKKRFFPEFSSSLDVGARFDTERREFTYDLQGRKSFALSDNGLLSIDVKGGYNFNPSSKIGTSRGVVELSCRVYNFTEDQDLKLKVGYNAVNRKPYFQIRENNWTLNAYGNGGWNIKYDL